MRILFVTPWVPASIRPRSLAFLRMLANEHEVRFLSLVRHATEARLADDLPVAYRSLVPNPWLGSMARSARSLVTGRSLQEGYASPGALHAALYRELAEWQPDAVHLNVFRTAHLVEACGGIPVLIDLDEFRSEYYAQLAETGPSVTWRALGRLEAGRMRAREDELSRAGVPVLLSAPPPPGQERPNTYVVRSVCDFPMRQTAPSGPPTVLFVGRLTYEANMHGLRWFLRECWPAVRSAVPDARLRVVGSAPRLTRALTADGVEVFANVPDVRPHYDVATVAIAPIFRGTGVQMKLIQALSAGIPTVTTTTVARRAGVADGVHVRVADDPAMWVAATLDLIRRPDEAARLATAGRAWVEAHHSPAAVREQLGTAYAALGVGAVAANPGTTHGCEYM